MHSCILRFSFEWITIDDFIRLYETKHNSHGNASTSLVDILFASSTFIDSNSFSLVSIDHATMNIRYADDNTINFAEQLSLRSSDYTNKIIVDFPQC
jgi:hypothetical protein